MTFEIQSTSPEHTFRIGEKIAKKLNGGEVIQLIGDLGAGKTQLVRGIVAGLGSRDAVASPSFTIERVYEGGQCTVRHYDFHRLNDPGIMKDELHEAMNDDDVILIEWPGIISEILGKNVKTITLKPVTETTRSLEFKDFNPDLKDELT